MFCIGAGREFCVGVLGDKREKTIFLGIEMKSLLHCGDNNRGIGTYFMQRKKPNPVRQMPLYYVLWNG